MELKSISKQPVDEKMEISQFIKLVAKEIDQTKTWITTKTEDLELKGVKNVKELVVFMKTKEFTQKFNYPSGVLSVIKAKTCSGPLYHEKFELNKKKENDMKEMRE
jgi:hypothetical protein